ncbi:MAG: 3-deoxy-D-manno-octulosonate 8-phosphate phosphatase, partial [Acidobacteria bacterium ACB2]|nr:3-deoxy-D-manno-octulosonate 8-phosphate phosphatase [Acidobacteria bacterium ACB2]
MPAAPIVPEDLRTKLLRIRGVALDVDGVLTDGSLTFDEDGREWKSFDVKDGLGLVLLRDLGYKIGIISSRKSKVVSARCRELKIPEECVLQGELDKASALDRLLARWELNPSEVVAVGDDLPDLAMMRRAGVGACPSDAVAIVRDAAALHLTKPGGCGAVRELCDL